METTEKLPQIFMIPDTHGQKNSVALEAFAENLTLIARAQSA